MEHDTELTHRNEVVLVGRVSAEPEPKQLPSGDQLLEFRLIVERPLPPRRARRTSRQDTIKCAVYNATLRRAVGRWRKGDVVEISGALHRRFLGGDKPTSIHEIEVAQARRLQRAALQERQLSRRA